jgi:Histone deacetylase domain
MKPRLATEDEVLRVHRPKLLERLLKPVDFDADTPYYPELKNTPDAQLKRRSVRSIWRSAVHHGNGTEAIVSGNNRIRFASVHQYPGYPGTGVLYHEAMPSIGQSLRSPGGTLSFTVPLLILELIPSAAPIKIPHDIPLSADHFREYLIGKLATARTYCARSKALGSGQCS